jgi:hypothetical protein
MREHGHEIQSCLERRALAALARSHPKQQREMDGRD